MLFTDVTISAIFLELVIISGLENLTGLAATSRGSYGLADLAVSLLVSGVTGSWDVSMGSTRLGVGCTGGHPNVAVGLALLGSRVTLVVRLRFVIVVVVGVA